MSDGLIWRVGFGLPKRICDAGVALRDFCDDGAFDDGAAFDAARVFDVEAVRVARVELIRAECTLTCGGSCGV